MVNQPADYKEVSMERRPSIITDELSLKILAFLRANCAQGYTTKELSMEHSIFSSQVNIQEKMGNLMKRGLVKVSYKGKDAVYQIVL